MQTRTCIYTHAFFSEFTYTHTISPHTCTHPHIHPHIHACTHAHTHIHTYMHAYTRTTTSLHQVKTTPLGKSAPPARNGPMAIRFLRRLLTPTNKLSQRFRTQTPSGDSALRVYTHLRISVHLHLTPPPLIDFAQIHPHLYHSLSHTHISVPTTTPLR